MDRDDLWIVEHFSDLVATYPGKYVAVVNESLVATGDSPAQVESEAQKKVAGKMPSVFHVPREEDLACLL